MRRRSLARCVLIVAVAAGAPAAAQEYVPDPGFTPVVAAANELYAVAHGLSAVLNELEADPRAAFPPNPVAPVNQLEALLTQLHLLEARVLAAMPDPGPPNVPSPGPPTRGVGAALAAVEANAVAIVGVSYPSPGPPNIEAALAEVRAAAQSIADLAAALSSLGL